MAEQKMNRMKVKISGSLNNHMRSKANKQTKQKPKKKKKRKTNNKKANIIIYWEIFQKARNSKNKK